MINFDDFDQRLAAAADRAFRLGLQQGRAIFRGISREALVERLNLVIVERRRPTSGNEVTFQESQALRRVYGAAHQASKIYLVKMRRGSA